MGAGHRGGSGELREEAGENFGKLPPAQEGLRGTVCAASASAVHARPPPAARPCLRPSQRRAATRRDAVSRLCIRITAVRRLPSPPVPCHPASGPKRRPPPTADP